MTFQSSFFIRCRMSPQPGESPVTSYYLQHVQTGAEFRSTDLAEINNWMTGQNARYVSSILEDTSIQPDRDANEDLQ